MYTIGNICAKPCIRKDQFRKGVYGIDDNFLEILAKNNNSNVTGMINNFKFQ